jgi:hypothetical protein
LPDITAAALYDYNATDETEISFKTNDKIKIIAQDPDGKKIVNISNTESI